MADQPGLLDGNRATEVVSDRLAASTSIGGLFYGIFLVSKTRAVCGTLRIDIAVHEFDDGHGRHVAIAEIRP